MKSKFIFFLLFAFINVTVGIIGGIIIMSSNQIIKPYVIINSSVNNSFEYILETVANEREYVRDGYNCVNFSEKLEKELIIAGWNATTNIVDLNCTLFDCEQYGYRHMIVEVDKIYLESITGKVINPFDYNEYGIK